MIVKNTSKAAAADIAVDATVRPADTASTVQELVASKTNTFSFPDQKLYFNGKLLSGDKRLSEYGIKEGDSLEFSFQASEKTIAKQLLDLLGKRAVSLEELGLLYSYRFAVSVEDALKALGHADCKLEAFLESQKCFSLEHGLVKVAEVANTVPPSNCLCPIEENKSHGPIEVKVSVEMHVAGRAAETVPKEDDDDACSLLRLESFDTVAKAKEIIAASEQVPFADRDLVFGGKKLKDEVSLHDAGVRNGDLLLLVVLASEACLASQLEELLRERVGLAPNELGLLYCQRFGTPICQALRILRFPSSLRRFLEGQPRFSIVGGCVTLVDGPKLSAPPAISIFDQVVNLLSEGSFLNIHSVEKAKNAGGEAVAVVYVKGLPPSRQAPLLQALQKAAVFGLESVLSAGLGMCSVAAAGDAVEVRVEGSQPVCIRLAAAPSSVQ